MAASALTVEAKAKRDASKWKKELTLSGKREKDWREDGEKIVKRYRGEEKKKNRWNVLWSNTSTLRPWIYNSRATPDVRRRFRDADPLGKAVSMVLERGLVIVLDDYSTDCAIKNDILDSLLPGRGVSRIRYIPSIRPVDYDGMAGGAPPTGSAAPAPQNANAEPSDDDSVSDEGVANEELEYERVAIEHVSWRDFRHGYGRVWEEVPWVGYRHKLTKSEAEETLGEGACKGIEFAVPTTDDPKKPGDETSETQQVAEFWEIWDKAGKRVFFLHENTDRILYPLATPDGEPPLDLPEFFPSPMPLYMVENTESLLPIPLFQLYEQQANELDKLSMRIDKVVDQMKLRGLYDAKLTELGDVMTLDDNELTPVQNAQAWRDGGLDKAISWLPIEQSVSVLQGLYAARVQTKAIIDELMGIADIMRGATEPDETATAQNLKQANGNTRLQWMRNEVQRYIRDLLRLAAQVMANKFTAQTFAEMTELKFPTAQQKAMLMQQVQQAQGMAQQAQATGQPPPPMPPPELLQVPSWDEIMGVMRNNALRYFKVDVETDSTVAGTLDADMTGMSEVLTAITSTLQGLAPLVQAKALPAEAAKEIVLSIIRRARLGMSVEDAFEKLTEPQAPPQQQDPALQVAQVKAQSDKELAGIKAQADAAEFQAAEQARAQVEQVRQTLETQRHDHEAQLKMSLEQADRAHRENLEQMKIAAESSRKSAELETQRMIADADNQTKLMIAELQAGHARDMQAQQQAHDQSMAQLNASLAPKPAAEAPAAADYQGEESGTGPSKFDQHLEAMGNLMGVMTQVAHHLSRPKTVVRDANGKIASLN
jgi:hypothetical protein